MASPQTTLGEATTPVSMQVLEAIAEADGTNPLELDTPLYTVIDTDALDTLCGVGRRVRVEFDYLDYRVTIHEDGSVSATEPERQSGKKAGRRTRPGDEL